jgi:3-oxoacyl-[acyl-carrier-protein] synthase II
MGGKVVITGMGSLTAAGYGVDALWQALTTAQSAITPIRRFDTAKYRTRIGAEVDGDVSAKVGFHVGNMSRNAQFAVAAAAAALADSGLPTGAATDSEIGICIGSGLGGVYFCEEALTALAAVGPRGISPISVPFVEPNGVVNQIAMKWGITGRQFTVSTACSSSAHAIGLAMEMIQNGRCDAVLAGGAEATISPLIFAGFDRLRAMSARSDDDATACRPFSRDRDGFVMGEGAAMLVLESEAHALARGATILAEVLSYASNGGAHHPVMPRPDASDVIAVMQRALDDAGLNPQDIDLINPHGTGTRLNDDTELLALRHVFGAHLPGIAVTPTKQLTGHLLGAAGALESVHLVKSIVTGTVTPVRHYDGDSGVLQIAVGAAHARPIRYALNNSFGFGNNNVSLLFGTYP